MQGRTSYFNDKGISEGYCRICGSYGELKKDHVPPKSLLTPGDSLYCSLFEGTMQEKIKKKKGLSGIYFKTICQKCNSETLGEIDHIYKDLKKTINDLYKFLNRGGNLIEKQKIPCDSSSFLRATIGHLLAVSNQESCMNPLEETDYFTPLREFVLGEREDLDNHEIRIWPYKKRKSVIIQTIASTSTLKKLKHGGELYSSMKAFPFGLSIKLKQPSLGIISFGDIVNPGMSHITFTPWMEPHKNYPEGIFRDDQMIMANSETGVHGQVGA
ncbi:hypothetical protein SAMN05216571_10110 [Onishia taeanensis]|uniref:Uncharacterized protein n=1 Tax=Onishia taeanensis TaxID=284577 RepID=A0A1G7MQD5_9GAMM|nr:hypothetical protein [Halomonas taeanensis]SDF63985.1 hypothetical protein SAMN05216571_10110 [Halomonas taeanensis]